MADPASGKPKASLLERLSSMLFRAPDDRAELIELLRQSRERLALDTEALAMIEGVLHVSEQCARDIMVARSQMDVIDISQPPSEFVPFAIRAAHSRFPVVDGDRDNVIGVLHAKDLLRLYAQGPVAVRDLLRPAVFIPESKRLDILLRDFRLNRNHLAIVVDEHGGVAGLITIEDVLEQIVGEIEDEFDEGDAPDTIVAIDGGNPPRRYRVLARTELDHFNAHFGSRIDADGIETVGGWVSERLGRMPRRGDRVEHEGLCFEILRADARSVHVLSVEKVQSPRIEARNDA
ncbi:MAG: HlyC/CorC family transporter [Burkholderiaceae bacterium]